MSIDTGMTSAEDAVRLRFAADPAAQHFGIEIVSISEDAVTLALRAEPWMINGHGILHGAALFWLGDTAFAFLSEAKRAPSVSRQADIAFVAPVAADAELRATATEKVRYGRNAIVEVDLVAGNELVARMTVHGSALRTR